MKTKILLLIIFLTNINIFAQEKVTWKRIAPEDFSTNLFSDFSQSDAVILQEEVKMYFSEWRQELRLFYEVKRRIKILDTAGLKFATVKIPFIDKEHFEEFINFEGATYNLVNNKVVKSKLKRKYVKDIQKNDYITERTARFPDVRSGSIIELKYTLTSLSFVHPRKWYFQHFDLPCEYSKFIFVLPDFIKYRFKINGQKFLTENKKEEERIFIDFIFRPTNPIPSTYGRYPSNYAANMHYEFDGYRFTYVMEHQKPFAKEPFSDSPENYINSITLDLVQVTQKTGYYSPIYQYAWEQLTRRLYQTTYMNYEIMNERKSLFVTYPAGFVVYTTTDWKDLEKKLNKNEKFGLQLIKYWNTKPILDKILQNKNNDLDKIIAIYDYVRKNFEWNGVWSVFTSDDLEKIANKKKGNSADLNFILIYLLNKAGIEAYPVLIRTVDKGWPEKDFPSLYQFNNVIVAVLVEGSYICLDATDKNRGWYALNPMDLNGWGRLIKKPQGKWIAISNPIKSKLSINAKLNPASNEYEIDASRQGSFINKNIKKEFLTIFKTKIKDSIWLDSKSIKQNLEVPAEETIEITGSKIIIKPFFVFSLKNPFSSPVRHTPVYFGSPFEKLYKITIPIPEGKMLVALPKSFSSETDGARVIFRSDYDTTNVYLSLYIMINKDFFTLSQYPQLRTMFEQISDLRYEQIIFDSEKK